MDVITIKSSEKEPANRMLNVPGGEDPLLFLCHEDPVLIVVRTF